MAYAALILFKQTLEKILHPYPQIESLMDKVCQLLDFLENSSENCNVSITDLEGKMRDAAYEGEDIIDSHLSKQVLPKSTSSFEEMSSSGIPNVIHAFPEFDTVDNDFELEINRLQKLTEEFDFILESGPSEIASSKESAMVGLDGDLIQMSSSGTFDHDLELIMEKFELILESVSKIKDGKAVEPLQIARNSLTAGPSRISFSQKSTTVGLDGDLIQIKDLLTGPSSHLEIISIVGMGGIGKTTLARNIYNDSLIDYHFDFRAWVTVSQNYYSQEILRDLLNSMRDVNSESHQMSIDEIAENLYKSLKGRRYLIVMDDVWDTKAWDDVKRLFPDDHNGSRIILTTRISDVALYANSFSSIHHMNLLSSEESWDLLCSKVFGEECCPSEFEEIGKKIAWNCKGLPLAIVVIGGLLSKGSRTQDYWEYIARNVMTAVIESDDQVMDILSLSYNYLPHHLKACFLYMGVFPEDHEILVSRLISLWVAEGFLKPHHSRILEEVAEEYLKDLIDRNLIMVGKQNHHGGIKTCIIHDLLRDLCVKKAWEEKFLVVLNRNARDLPEVAYNEYRISIHSHILRIGMHDSRVRSFLYFAVNFSKNLALSFVRFGLLKVLDALAITFHSFPIEIVELVNLRYLAFTCGFMNGLPAAIIKLKNLQTLILKRHSYWIITEPAHLPSEIWEMPQLRHLSFKRCLLPYLSSAQLDREMVNLYTLSQVENLICKKEVFQVMPNLKKLGISYSNDWSTELLSYDFNSFVYLYKLETLKLFFFADHPGKYVSMNFAFPVKLRKLTLSGCSISWNNMTIVGSLPNLEVLKLKTSSFKGLVWEPNEGEFLRLKFLLLDRISLESWKANEMHFPNLEHISLNYCLELGEIPCAIGNIPTLQILEVYKCRDSVVKSAKLIEEEQQSLGNDSIKVLVTSLLQL